MLLATGWVKEEILDLKKITPTNMGLNSSNWLCSGNLPNINEIFFAGFYAVKIQSPVVFSKLFSTYFIGYKLFAVY